MRDRHTEGHNLQCTDLARRVALDRLIETLFRFTCLLVLFRLVAFEILIRRNLRVEALAWNGRGRNGFAGAFVWHVALLWLSCSLEAFISHVRQRVPTVHVGCVP